MSEVWSGPELRFHQHLRHVSAIAVALLLLADGVQLAHAQQAKPSSQEEYGNGTPLDRLNFGSSGAERQPAPPSERPAFIEDARFNAQLKTFYFNREKYDKNHMEAWALGGSATFQSGYLADLVRIGAVVYTSQKLHGPENRDGTLLLKPGQESYTVLGQAYAEIKLTDRIFGAIGRKVYNTPYINAHDVRMTPNTFEGITTYGTAGGKDGAPAWRFGAGYIDKIKEKNSDKFIWMSRDAGGSVDRGVFLAGANYTDGDFSLGAIDYFSEDIINIFYTEAKYTFPLSGSMKLALGAQYTNQHSTGSELLTGSRFSTHQAGVKADLLVGAATLTLGYTNTGKGADIRNPWSGAPGYTSVQVLDFNRANERALIARVAYDFTAHGIPGLTAYALAVRGSGRLEPNRNENEYDLNLQWTPKEGVLKGSSWRIRYAHVDQKGGGSPNQNDFRFIGTWDF